MAAPIGYDLIRVDALVRLLAVGQRADQVLHHRHAGRTAHQHDLVEVGGCQVGILQARTRRARGSGSSRSSVICSNLARVSFNCRCFGPDGIGGDVGQVDLGLHHGGELDLGLFGGFAQALEGLAVLAQVDALLLLELIRGPVDDALIPVVAAQVGVAVGGLDFDDAFAHFQDGYIEGTAAQVEDQDGLILLLIQTVGQRRGGRLVDDAHHFQPGDLAGILGGLALAVVEIGRHGDDGLR